MTKKFKKFISVVCISVLAVCSIGNVCFAEQESDKFTYTVDSKFNDVKTSDWFYDAVAKCEDLGIIQGYGDGKFGPNDNITMQQVCLMSLRCISIWRWPDTNPDYRWLQDGFKNDPFIAPTLNARFEEIIPSVTDVKNNSLRFLYGTDFKQNAYREEALSCLYKTYQKENYKEWIDKMDAIRGIESKIIENPNIPDESDITDFYKNDIIEAYKIGLAQGYDSTGAFKPKNEITRAEFCQIIFNSGIVEMIHAKKNGLL